MLITETQTVKQFSDESEFESTLSFSLDTDDVEDWVVVENDAQELSLSLANWKKLVQLGNKVIFNQKKEQLSECQQELFNYLHDLGIIALESEMQEIQRIVFDMQTKIIYNQIKELYDNENITGFSKRAYAQCLDIVEQFKKNKI
jgi:hypothetical protein